MNGIYRLSDDELRQLSHKALMLGMHATADAIIRELSRRYENFVEEKIRVAG